MDEVLVVFEGVYGTTREYAMWIREEFNCKCKRSEDVTEEDVEKAKIVIYGGALYAGKIKGISKILKYKDLLMAREFILFTVGLADVVKDWENLEGNIVNALPKDLYNKTKSFKLRGNLDYSKMSMVHKGMMWGLKKMIQGKKDMKEQERAEMLKNIGSSVEFVSRDQIEPLVEYVKGLI